LRRVRASARSGKVLQGHASMSHVIFSIRARHARVGAIAAATCLALSAVPRPASADTILTFDLISGSVLAGNPTTPPSAFCATGSLCPGSPAYGLAASEPLSGTVSFDLTKDTMSFDLTLAQNAAFGALTVDAGSTFVATSQGVTVGSTTKGGVTTYTFAPGSTDTVVTNLLLSAGFTATQNTPSMPGIECSATTRSGSCSLTIGTPTDSGSGSLLINSGGTSYNGVLSVSANMTPVPLPASVWLVLGGLGTMLFTVSRRRSVGPQHRLGLC
jgi:hypothetical protein